ncbi:MAG: BrnT family toxin [Acidobacteria bacterium]|nr:BrnT family toxin [Acidobacteriota bacterium]
MEFDWDAANIDHIAKHEISTEECEQAYHNGPMVINQQKRHGERRLLCLGHTASGRLLTFVATERGGRIRFVTAFPMNKKQREIYRGG